MKKFYKVLFAFLFPVMLFANGIDEGKFNKQKRINKAYAVNSDAGIDIDNSFGPVYVTTWDEDKIEIDIIIKVSGNSESWVDKRLNSIDIEINALTTLVSAKTKIGHLSGNSGNNSMEISYTIKIPKKGSTKVTNKYGDVLSADLFGPVKLNVKYGNVKMAKLNSTANNIDLEYCGTVNFERVRSGVVHANYSKVNIGNFENLSISTNYTDLTATDGNNMKYDSNYGKLTFGELENLEGNGNYLTVNTTNIKGNLKINADYTTVRISNVSSSAGNIQVSGGYNTIDMRYTDAYAFDFDINGKYTNIRLDDDIQVNSRQETNRDKSYRGFHKKSGDNKVSISGQYGNVTLKNNQ